MRLLLSLAVLKVHIEVELIWDEGGSWVRDIIMNVRIQYHRSLQQQGWLLSQLLDIFPKLIYMFVEDLEYLRQTICGQRLLEAGVLY